MLFNQGNSKHFPVKEQNRAQGLIVSRCRHLAVGGEMRQKCLDFAGTHVARMPHGPAIARPANEEANPVDVHLLGAEAIVHVPNALAQLVQDPGGPQRRGAGFHGVSITGHISSILATSQAASHLQEGHMTNLWSSAQLIEQVLLWTLR